ncbi:MAG: hypothetical protein Q7R54_02185 [bacterium]|nr:hypothetical protein [bacterium]
MKNKLILGLLALSLVGFGIGYVLTNSIKFGICMANNVITDASCINFYERVGDPIFYGMGALTIVFLVLLFIPRTFSAWKKFAMWFVPLAALLFIFYPDPGSGDLFSPYPEQVFQWVSSFYVLVSVVIIAIASLRKPE